MRKGLIGLAIIIAAIITIAFGYFFFQYRFYTKEDPTKWEDDIKAIEARTAGSPLKGRAVVFIGSSSILKWESLERDMDPVPVIRHGFGGSRIKDSTWFVPRLVTAYHPPAVVLYAGDNDIYFRDLFGAKPDTAGQCLEDFKVFVAAVHRDLPRIRIYFVSIKPSVDRMKFWPQMKAANELIRDFCARDPRLAYIDIATPMIAGDGTPRGEYFLADGLHLNEAGYWLWTSIIKPVLQ
ncbi:MAG: hypothetical protein EPN93_20975 [Spirochaetes bacterium]|nr:MAG: hypothetical protein EPN93_20975 [Spirochaetota bacterium]